MMAAIPDNAVHRLLRLAGPLSLLLAAAPAAAEAAKRITQFSHVVWQEKDGLPDDRVGAILQTRDGYLWFGTLNGLARFDGVRFTAFDAASSDAPLLHRVTALLESKDGSLWAGGRSGLTRYRAGRFSSVPLPEQVPTGGVRQILEDDQGRLWVRTRSDLMVLRGERLEVVARPVRSIGLLSGGGLRVVTPEGIGRLEGERVAIERAPPRVPGEESPFSLLSDVAEEADGTLWLGAPWGLGRLSPSGAWRVYTRRDGLPDTAVSELCLDAKGTLWIGTQQGLARFEHGELVQGDGGHPLSSQRIEAIYADRDHGVWIGTDTDGVHQLREGVFTPVTSQEGLSDDLVTPILEAAEGSLWIGTARGLNRLRGGRVTTFTSRDGLSDDSVFALAEDARGRIFVGTAKGLDVFDGGRLRPFQARGFGPLADRVTALRVASDGALWIGTDASGAYRVEGGTATRLGQQAGLTHDHVAHIHERPDGSVWLATDRGIVRWHEGRLQQYGTSDGLSGPQVRAFHEAGDSLWIGTYGGGLTRYRAGRFGAVPVPLPDNVVYAILEDERKELWLSSNRGIIRVARQALESFADGRMSTPPPFVLYDIGDGLKSSMCVGNCQPAAWKARDGRFWFPTRRGAVFIDPRHPGVRKPPAPPLIERLLVDGRPLAAAGAAEAAPGRGDLELDFTAPSFRHPAALRFRYRLDGFDRDWQDAGSRRTAQYTKVPPGRYVFRVAAVSADGVASHEEATLALRLRPHFYETSWFYVAGLSGLLLLGFGVYRAKLRQVQSRFALVLAERSRIAREMHDALDQGFAAITLQLNLAARLAENPDEPRASLRQRLDLASRLLEYARAESKRSISDLRSQALESGDLVEALSKVAEQFGLGEGLKVDVSVQGAARRLPGAVENNLLRICQEALANAVRHGHAREVAIDLAFAARSVALKVRDAGRGFDVASAVSEQDGHFGLMGIRERAQRLGGRFQLESAPGRGTQVLVEIPVPLEAARPE